MDQNIVLWLFGAGMTISSTILVTLFAQVSNLKTQLNSVYSKAETNEMIKLFMRPLTEAIEEMRRAIDRLNSTTGRLDKALEVSINEIQRLNRDME